MPLKKVRFGSKAKAIYPTHYVFFYKSDIKVDFKQTAFVPLPMDGHTTKTDSYEKTLGHKQVFDRKQGCYYPNYVDKTKSHRYLCTAKIMGTLFVTKIANELHINIK